MPGQTTVPSFTDSELSPEDFAAQWGRSGVHARPNLPGDGYLFYNFVVEQGDPDFRRQSFRPSSGPSNSSRRIPTGSRPTMPPICKNS